MGVLDDEPPGREVLDCVSEVLLGLVVVLACTRAPVENSRAVRVGLEATDAPDAGIRERSIVEIHRVLRRYNDADAEGAGLLHERDERPFRWGIRWVRWKKAVDFVEDDECLQAIGSGQCAHPGQDLLEQHSCRNPRKDSSSLTRALRHRQMAQPWRISTCSWRLAKFPGYFTLDLLAETGADSHVPPHLPLAPSR